MKQNMQNITQQDGQCDYIHGISCDVHNCYYNDNGNICTANQIKVGPQFAASSADTACATFKPE